MKPLVLLAVATAGLTLAACQSGTKAPYDQGVCYSVETDAKGQVTYNRVAEGQPQIEFCAARLEEMRLRFLRMGGNRREITGAFQGQFIFIDRAGVSFAKTLEGTRFMALARTGDGRLAIPGAIQRQIDGAPPAAPAN